MNAKGWWFVCLIAALSLGCAEGPRPVGQTVPRILYKPSPVYPEGAYVTRAKGRVDLSLVVDTLGVTQQVKILREDPPGMGFGEAAAQAVGEWIWEPASMDGVPVEMGWQVSLLFDPSRSERIPALATLAHRTPCPPPEGFNPREEGGVLLLVRISADGTPDSVTVVRESPAGAGLGKAAKECVQAWRWNPGMPAQAYVPVRFPPAPAK
jgi:TonB family protein